MNSKYALVVIILVSLAANVHAVSQQQTANTISGSTFTFNALLDSVLNKGIDTGHLAFTKEIGNSSQYGFFNLYYDYNTSKPHGVVLSGFAPSIYGGIPISGPYLSQARNGSYDNIMEVSNTQLSSLLSDYGVHKESESIWFAAATGSNDLLGPESIYEVSFKRPINPYTANQNIYFYGQKLKIVKFNIPYGWHRVANGNVVQGGGVVLQYKNGTNLTVSNYNWFGGPSNGIAFVQWTTYNGLANSLYSINIEDVKAKGPTYAGQNYTMLTIPGSVPHILSLVKDNYHSNLNNVTISTSSTTALTYHNVGSISSNAPIITNISEPAQLMTVASDYKSAFNVGGLSNTIVYDLTPYQLNEYATNTNSMTISTNVMAFYDNYNAGSWINANQPLVVDITGYTSNTATASITQTLTINSPPWGYNKGNFALPSNLYNITNIHINRALPVGLQYLGLLIEIDAVTKSGNQVTYTPLAALINATPGVIYNAPSQSYYSLSQVAGHVTQFTVAKGETPVNFYLNVVAPGGGYTEYYSYVMNEIAAPPTPAVSIRQSYIAIAIWNTTKGTGASILFTVNRSTAYAKPGNLTYRSTAWGTVQFPVEANSITERGSEIYSITPTQDVIGFAKKIQTLRFIVK
ncbi:MAG: hypothetical protein ACHQX1_00875 [Candidatus Micrarchaeales archaeon]